MTLKERTIAFLNNDWQTLAVCSILTILSLFWYYPGHAPSGDAGYKVLQAHDLLLSGFSDFRCIYPSRDIDPELQFIPFLEPFMYILGQDCFYVFPFQLSILNAAFYWLAGAFGIYLISALSAIGVLFILRQTAFELAMPALDRSLLLLFSLVAYGYFNYALGQNEYTLSAFLAGLAIYFALKDRWTCALLSGLAIGLNVQIRPETGILAALLPIGLLIWKRNWKASVALTLAFLPGVALFLLANQGVFGHALGLRGIVFIDYQPTSWMDRLHRLLLYLAGRKTAVFVQTPVFLFALFSWQRTRKLPAELKSSCRLLITTVAGYLLAIPLAVPNYPGPQFGERFVFNVYPILGLLAFLSLRSFRSQKAAWIVAGAGLAFSFTTASVQLLAAKKMDHAVADISRQLRNETRNAGAVILRNHALANAFFSHYHDNRYLLAQSPEKFHKLISLLEEKGLTRIAVVHSKANYRKLYGMAPDFTPADFVFSKQSEDKGNELFELRIYELKAVGAR